LAEKSNITQIRQPDGAITQLGYDAIGNLTRYSDALGNTTLYVYETGLSQPEQRIDPNGNITHYHYDAPSVRIVVHPLEWDFNNQ